MGTLGEHTSYAQKGCNWHSLAQRWFEAHAVHLEDQASRQETRAARVVQAFEGNFHVDELHDSSRCAVSEWRPVPTASMADVATDGFRG